MSGDQEVARITPSWPETAVREALSLPAPTGSQPITFSAISTDSRTLKQGALFIALTGERFDGHDHLTAAANAGASGAVVRKGTPEVPGLVLFPVDDTLRAYGQLARVRRRSIGGPVVAITGTNGKTSTKEMLAAVLATRYQTYATRANLNNLVGVPQTILESPSDTEALIVEAGANLPGEIARYREIIEPSIAIVTNAVAGHLEGFGSLAGVVEEKLSLTDQVPLAIVGTDPPTLAEGARRRARQVRTAGLRDADLIPERVTLDETARPVVTVQGYTFRLAARGLHQADNAIRVWAAAEALGIAPELARAALEQF
ncbi:MAG TPA: UDP-N-acetylmuramoyl-tripeptide--D-alanyl-D-alanine ligase, partial [Gemmatimonadales bacterium]|nr:UDP-N-acetylmuramoyl-tripeptide--D-alanyl-D-alanine ligase [Gemmatimonadales bacterium]